MIYRPLRPLQRRLPGELDSWEHRSKYNGSTVIGMNNWYALRTRAQLTGHYGGLTLLKTAAARMISLLSKEAGADIASISKKFGWLPHTTRALTGLRKAGYEIASVKSGKGKPTKYHITSAPTGQSAQ